MASLFLTGAKKQALDAIFVSGNTYKVAIFNSSYTTTTATYGTTNEVTGTNWPAGGVTLSGLATTTSGTTAFADFSDVSVATVTITAGRYLVVYDDTDNDEVRAVFDNGSDFAATAGTLAITWPTADASNAMVRIA
jgi:hypothetical protein